jgi:hypothetical protein
VPEYRRETRLPDVGLVDSGSFFVEEQLKRLGGAVEPLDIYELPNLDLDRLSGLLVPGSVDQEWLYLHREVIEDFLNKGRVVVFSGHLFRPWLPGASSFVPKQIDSFRDYAVSVVKSHPVFVGVKAEDLTFRKGVAGFFARGHHPPPSGAEVLLALADGEPITYLDRSSSGGTILLHSGNDLWGYVEDETTAARMVPQLLWWIREEGGGGGG